MKLTRWLAALAVFVGLSAVGLRAQNLTFTFSDPAGDAGSGTLNAVGSGLGDDSLWAISGTLNLTASSLGSGALGTYSLIAAGPGITPSPSGLFVTDNLIYPSNDAASGTSACQTSYIAISNPSYLTYCGLLFGPDGSGTGNQSEINIWGSGGMTYGFGSVAGGVYTIYTNPGGTFSLPEPPTSLLLVLGTLLVAAGLLRRGV